MVYFGWPQAHEDDAQRAVHAGLGIIEAMSGLNVSLEQEKGIRLAVRIGIHTGLVVVGEIGQGARQEHLALGETPNVASRIEGVAEHDTVAISDATYQLIQGYFVCEDLGQHTLKGVDDSQQVYRVARESDAQSRLDVAAAIGLTPLVGRESESALLFDRWQQVKDGQGQIVLLSGEAGIGKSRLLQVLRDRVSNEPHLRLECRSSPYYQNTALYPITNLLQRILEWQPDDASETKLEKLEQMLQHYRLPLPETIPLFATILSLPLSENQYPPLTLSPQQQRQKTLEIIVAMLLAQAEQQPVLFILEDLHWTDPSTLELLELLIDQIPITSICVLLTCRPEFEPPWGLRSHLTPIALNRFTRPQIEAMVAHVTDRKRLPVEVMQHLLEKTDGVPLYVEEMTKAILESGVLHEIDGHYVLAGPLTALAVPATLQDSLLARLDRLGTAKGIAQLGATIGRQFAYQLLQAVSQFDASTLQQELGRLVDAELVYQRGSVPEATFTFKHALIQDTAYQSLLKRTRQQYHQRIAQTLEARFPEMTETRPELLAHHCTEAELTEQAVAYWQRAGQCALQRSAHAEAITHLTQGLGLLSTLPDTPKRDRQELVMQTTLGSALIAAKGHAAPEVLNAFGRARELCEQVGERRQLFQVLRGLFNVYLTRMELQRARELGEHLLALAEAVGDSGLRLEAHYTLGNTLNYLAEFATAQSHLAQGIALYDPQQHSDHAFRYGQDPGVVCRVYSAVTLWCLGYPDQAAQRRHEAQTLAREVAHLFSLAYSQFFGLWILQFRREWQQVHEQAQACIDLTAEQGFTQFRAGATIFRGWALATGPPEPGTGHAHLEEGLAQMQQGLKAWSATGAKVLRPYGMALLAEAHARMGQHTEGLTLLAEALAVTNVTEERRWEAELHRLKGKLLLAQGAGNTTEAEACFNQALDIARRQRAKSWELRTTTSLARLWQSQGKGQEAYDLLQPVYGWFTEGFDTADLQEAKSLLQELAG
jgi:predicted ATPase